MRELVDHTADLEVHVAAPTLDDALAEAGAAFFEVIAGDLSQIRPRTSRTFDVPAACPLDVLHEWLAALHAAFEIDRMLFHDFAPRVRDGRLHGTATGEPYDATRHRLAHEVKAVTRHRLSLRPTPAGWEATFVVDV